MSGAPVIAASPATSSDGLDPPLDVAVAGYLAGYVPYGVGDELVWRVPRPRFHLDLRHARFPADVRAKGRRAGWTATASQAFDDVVSRCASVARADEATWLTKAVQRLYQRLHRAGLACSFEVWNGGALVAGELGVLVGGVYFCETKFHLASGAGSWCSAVAVTSLAAAGVSVYDAQYGPKYLRRFSHRGLEPFDDGIFRTAVAAAAAQRMEHSLTQDGTIKVRPL